MHFLWPSQIWYHGLKNRLFWWLVIKKKGLKVAFFFPQGETTSDAVDKLHKLLLPGLHCSSEANCEYTNRLHRLSSLLLHLTFSPACPCNSKCDPTMQLNWNCHVYFQCHCSNVASISFWVSAFFLLCFWAWEQPPFQQFRNRGVLNCLVLLF